MLALIIATAISTSQLGRFAAVPEWMPDEVAATATFGSDTFVTNRALTVTNAAAYRAVYESRLERAYCYSAGISNIWDETQHGSVRPYAFDFGNAYIVSTNVRYEPFPRRALRDRGVRSSITKSLTNDAFFAFTPISRPSWGSDAFWLSSTMMLDGQPLDGDLTGFDWTANPRSQLDWETHGVGLQTLAADDYGIHANPVSELAFRCFEQVAHGDDSIAEAITGETYDECLTNLIDAAYATPTDYDGLLHPTNSLIASHPWATAADRIYAAADRSYTGFKPRGETVIGNSTQYIRKRGFHSGNLSLGGITYRDDGGHVSMSFSPIELTASDWAESASFDSVVTNAVTNVVSEMSVELSDINSTVVASGSAQVSHTFMSLSAFDVNCMLESAVYLPTNVVTIYATGALTYDLGGFFPHYTISCDGHEYLLQGFFFVPPTEPIIANPAAIVVSREYSATRTGHEFTTDYSSESAAFLRPCAVADSDSRFYLFRGLDFFSSGAHTYRYTLADGGIYRDPYAILRSLNLYRQTSLIAANSWIVTRCGDYEAFRSFAPMPAAWANGSISTATVSGFTFVFTVKWQSYGEGRREMTHLLKDGEWIPVGEAAIPASFGINIYLDLSGLRIDHEDFVERQSGKCSVDHFVLQRTDWHFDTLRRE